MDRSKILDKITKLLALASNVSLNENEAIVANTKAQELITRFQIEEAELNSVNKKDLEVVYCRIDTKSKSDILWKNKLCSYLTEVNNSRFIITKQYRCTIYTVFGSKSNVELIQILFELISNQIEYLSKNKFDGKGKSENNSYKLGVVTTVGQRLRETREKIIEQFVNEQKALSNNSTALVYLNKEIESVKEYVDNFYAAKGQTVGIIKKERKINLKHEAYNLGLKDGRSVTITNQLALKE